MHRPRLAARHRPFARAVVLALAVIALLAPASASAANTYNVSNTNDVAAANPSAGCATPNAPPTNGACTLRSAVQAANQFNGASTINLAKGTYKLTIGPTGSDNDASGDLNIFNDVGTITINGAGSATSGTVIDGNLTDRVFDVQSGAVGLTLNQLRIINGRTEGLTNASSCPTQAPSPSNTDGGGIRTRSVLTLRNDVITGNMAAFHGGGIAAISGGAIDMKDTTVSNNIACPTQFDFDSGGGIDQSGFADLTIDRSTISGNSAKGGGVGGGVLVSAHAGITNTTISGNDADIGGGIDSAGGSFASIRGAGKAQTVLSLFADTLSGNTARTSGGGMNNSGGQDTVVNTTITGNTGSAISSPVGSTTIYFSTLAHNDGNLQNRDSGQFTIGDTILADPHSGANCNGGVTSNGHNLFDDAGTTCSPSSTDLTNKNPKLGPLQNNGGPTKTLALLTGSPAINRADDQDCSGQAKNVDQRGVTRPQGPHCDIGAYEYQSADLALTASAAKDTINVGENDTVTDVVTNNGPSDDTNVVFTDPAANFKIKSVTPSQGSCTHTNKTVKCQLGKLGKGNTAKVKIKLTGKSQGTITLNSSVQGALPDPKPSNNHATVKIKVVKPAQPSCARSRFHFEYDTEDPKQDDRVTVAKVYVDGHLTETHHGHNIVFLHINPMPMSGTHHVKVIGFITDGRQIILRRTYHGCSHGHTRVHIEEANDSGPDTTGAASRTVAR